MGCRKKGWLCLSLCSVFLWATCANGVSPRSPLTRLRCENEDTLSPANDRVSYVNAEPRYRRRRERNLMVVLPVMTGNNNYSTDKLQFWYTKAPVTVVIKDAFEDATKAPQPSAQSAGARPKQTVYTRLTDSSRSQATGANVVPDSPLAFHYRTTTGEAPYAVKTSVEKSTSHSSSLKDAFEYAKKWSPKPVPDAIRADGGERFALLGDTPTYAAAVTFLARPSSPYAPNTSATTTTTTNEPHPRTSSPAPETRNDTGDNANWNLNEVNSTFDDEDRLLSKLAENVHAPPNRVTEDIKTILFELGILKANETVADADDYAHAPRPQEPASAFVVDAVPYATFKRIPTHLTRTPVRDDMRRLLDSFGLLPRNKRPDGDRPAARTSRQTSERRKSSATFGHRSLPRKRSIRELFAQAKLVDDNNRSTDLAINGIAGAPASSLDLKALLRQPVARISFLIPENRNRIAFSLPLNQTIPLSPEELENIPVINLGDLKKMGPGFDFSEPFSSATSANATRSANDTASEETAANATGEDNVSVADLSNLLASFGGKETGDAPTAAPVNDEPTAKPNGLYFWVDWNKFNDVGDKVRRRFSPKVGNPRNFLPITVP